MNAHRQACIDYLNAQLQALQLGTRNRRQVEARLLIVLPCLTRDRVREITSQRLRFGLQDHEIRVIEGNHA